MLMRRLQKLIPPSLVAALLAYAFWRGYRDVSQFRFDDTYITLRYARNLALHGHLSFNLDDRVDGFTSPLWTLILAGAIRLGFDGERAALALSAGSGALAAILAALVAMAMRCPPGLAVAFAGLGTILFPGFVVWAVPGMETPLAALIALTAFALYGRLWGRNGPAAHRMRCVGLVILPLTRPEFAVLTVMFALGETIELRQLWSSNDPEFRLRARDLALALGALGALFVAHWVYYGFPLPNTFYAKRGNAEMAQAGWNDAVALLRSTALWLAPVAAAAATLSREGTRQIRWAHFSYVVWFCAAVRAYSDAGGDHMGFHRFYQPLVPLSLAILAASIGRRMFTIGTGVLGLGQFVLGGLVVWFLNTMYGRELERAFLDNARDIRVATDLVRQWGRAADALRRHYSPRTSIAVRAAGVIPWRTDFRTIDTLALNNPILAHSAGITRNVPGHQREATFAQIVGWRPDLIINHPCIVDHDATGAPPDWCFVREYPAAGYRFNCVPATRAEWICVWESPNAQRRAEPPRN